MNPGYLTFILMCIVAILCASGWKDVLMKGVSHQAVLLFFMAWVASWVWTPALGSELRWHGCVIPLAACTIWALTRVAGWMERLHLVSVGLLLASFYYVMQMIGKIDPIVLLPNAGLGTALLIGSVAAAAASRPIEQIAAICLGSVVGEMMFWYANDQWLPQGLFGKTFQDTWWMTLVANRACAVSMQACESVFRKLQRWLLSGRKEDKR